MTCMLRRGWVDSGRRSPTISFYPGDRPILSLPSQMIGFIIGCLLAVLPACSKRAMIPPKFDLKPFAAIGLVDFETKGETDLGASIREQFLQALITAQPGIRVVELGKRDALLAEVEMQNFNAAAAQAIGSRRQLSALLIGTLTTKKTKPSFHFDSGNRVGDVHAMMTARLRVKLIDTNEGATLWSVSADEQQPVAGVTMDQGAVSVDIRDRDRTDQRLVRQLVEKATRDFRPTRE